MRALFCAIPAAGHLLPLVPLSWSLRAAGHEVLVGAPEAFHRDVVESGLPVVATAGPFDPRPLIEDMLRMPSWRSDGRAAPDTRARTRRGAVELAERVVPGTVEVIRAWRADLVVGEPAAFGARIAAAYCGLPYVEHWWGPALPPHVRAAADAAASGLSREMALGDALPEPDMTIDVCPPSYQYEHATPTHRVRYLPFSGPSVVPAALLGPATRPRVCVTTGTITHWLTDMVDINRTIVDAVAAAGGDVVLATNDPDATRELATHPAVAAVGRLPLDPLLGRCDLVVHHGGSGVSLTAAAHALPQVVLPVMADQHLNAERLEAVGVARRVSADDLTVPALRDVVRDALHSPGLRDRARELAAEVRGQPLPAAVVPDMDTLARREGTGHG